MAGLVITVTAYEAFGRLHVLATQVKATEKGREYMLLANEDIALVDTSTHPVADALSQLGVVVWGAAERIQSAAF